MTTPARDAGAAGAFLEDLPWPDVARRFADDPVVVVPFGAFAKEHGPHLPLKTDSVIARALARALVERLPVLAAPVVGFGYYPAFRHYPGSQHLAPETFAALVAEILEGYVDQGVRRLAVINTGVSTEAPLRVAVRELYERRRVRVAVADISRFARAEDAGLEQELGGHGDELETSLMLAIEPGSVRLERAAPDYGHHLGAAATVYYQPAIFDPDASSGIDYSATGVRGDPTLATPEKGRRAFRAMADRLANDLVTLFPDLGDGNA